jgi:DedD protein
MDQQLKERLVGAAVLVALTAIFVPMVLDGPTLPTAAVPPTLAPAPVDASTFGYDLSAPLPGAPAPTTAGPAAAQPSAIKAPEPKPAMPKATTPAAPPKAQVATTPKAGTAAPSSGGWAAQVGSFSEKANADRIAADLKSGGFKAFVMEHREGGKTYYRVRVGPVASREAAAALASRITQQTKQAARPVRHP